MAYVTQGQAGPQPGCSQRRPANGPFGPCASQKGMGFSAMSDEAKADAEVSHYLLHTSKLLTFAERLQYRTPNVGPTFQKL